MSAKGVVFATKVPDWFLLHCSDTKKCTKNHVHYFKDRSGYHAEFIMAHFKNDNIKGIQHLPVAQKLLPLLSFLERAHAWASKNAPTLWCMANNKSIYAQAYWSIVCSDKLSFGGHKLTAKHFRHLFATAWRDYINSPASQLNEISVRALDVAAAELMLSSTDAYDVAYDDTNRARTINTIFHHWDKFVEFVHEQHKDIKSREPFNPITIDMQLLET